MKRLTRLGRIRRATATALGLSLSLPSMALAFDLLVGWPPSTQATFLGGLLRPEASGADILRALFGPAALVAWGCLFALAGRWCAGRPSRRRWGWLGLGAGLFALACLGRLAPLAFLVSLPSWILAWIVFPAPGNSISAAPDAAGSAS